MFLYAFVFDASISFPHLFFHSLNEIHRSLAITASEPVHVVASTSATFLRQRAAYMRAGSTRPRVEPSGAVPLPPSSIGDVLAKASGAGAADADVPPPTTSDDLDIRRTLDHVLTVQAAHG